MAIFGNMRRTIMARITVKKTRTISKIKRNVNDKLSGKKHTKRLGRRKKT